MISGLETSSQANVYTPFAKVEDFSSASRNNDPNLYPGQRPHNSYITDGLGVYDVHTEVVDGKLYFSVPTSNGEASLDEYLQAKGVPLMEDRLPVLAFGANMCPGSLASKFQKDVEKVTDGAQSRLVDCRPDLSIVPNIYARLKGHDVVWSGGPGMNGNFTAVLYAGEETRNTAVQVGINFLTREQLLMMHATELSYNLSTTAVEVAGKQVRAYYYVGTDSIYTQDGLPIAVDAVPAADRNLEQKSTSGLLNQVLSDTTLLEELCKQYPDEYPGLNEVINAEQYVAYARNLLQLKGKGARLVLKRRLGAAIATHGHSVVVESEHASQGLVSWANPSTLANYGEQLGGLYHHEVYRLPSQEVASSAWRSAVARKRVIYGVSAHLLRVNPELQEAKKPEEQHRT